MNDTSQKLLQLADEYLNEGKILFGENQMQKALMVIQKAKDLFAFLDDKKKYADANNVLGVIYSAVGNESVSIDCYLEALNVAEEIGYERVMILGYNNIGSRYQSLQQHGNAVVYFNKAEQIMDMCECTLRSLEQRVVLIVYMNLMESYYYLENYELATKYLEKARGLIELEENEEYRFPFLLVECHLRWKQGDHEFAKAKLPELMQGASENRSINNYMQDMGNCCELLMWMQEYDKWKETVETIEAYKGACDNLSLSIFVAEMWLDYYLAVGDTDHYLKKSVEYTELSRKTKQIVNIERVVAVDSKIEVWKKEKARKNAEVQLNIDTLTGVGNRAKLRKDFENLKRRMRNRKMNLGVGILDIDYFKVENDTYGHLEGDECLIKVSCMLKQCVENLGMVYRFGGDEFVVLLPNAKQHTLDELAERIKAGIRNCQIPNQGSPVGPWVTLSQGYVFRNVDKNAELKDLLDEADKALYKVKTAGRNGYRIE